jgi:CheY-like chemotaxis protein
MPSGQTILLIDDDPSHLTLYSLIVERAGYRANRLLINTDELQLPDSAVDLVVMDYRLGATIKTPAVAGLLRKRFPSAPLIVLSDLQWMPDDMQPFASSFVRKGEPEQLLEAIASALN